VLTRHLNHRPPTQTMDLPQPLDVSSTLAQVHRWASIHPSAPELPPSIHPEVALRLAEWVATTDTPALLAFSADGTIGKTLVRELGSMLTGYHGIEYLAVRALWLYVKAAREVTP
jgi:hypothetical protein